ncbi:MAG TPA: response regulator transcription factor [Acidimicrobiales bacterium]
MRIAVVEDHRFVADLLAGELRSMGHDASAVGPEGVDGVLADPPDLVVLDLQLAGLDGTELVAPLVRRGASVIVLSGTPDVTARARCVEAGALAVLDKASGLDRVVEALRRAVAGETPQSPAERATILDSAREARRGRSEALKPFAELTAREQQVLAALVAGLAVADVARELYLSVETVRSYVKSLLRKLGVGSQLAAVALANDAGWVPATRRDMATG